MSKRRRSEDDVDRARYNRLLELMTVDEVRELEALHEGEGRDRPMHRWRPQSFTRAVQLFEAAYYRLDPAERWFDLEDNTAA